LIYDLEQGKTEEVILRQCVRERLPIPDAIANAPEMGHGLDFYLAAYVELSSCRVQDGLIPWTAIANYCIAHDLDSEMCDEIMFIVRRVDTEIQSYRFEKEKAKAKSDGKNRTRS